MEAAARQQQHLATLTQGQRAIGPPTIDNATLESYRVQNLPQVGTQIIESKLDFLLRFESLGTAEGGKDDDKICHLASTPQTDFLNWVKATLIYWPGTIWDEIL